MFSNETYQIAQGGGLTLTAVLSDDQGDAITTFTGSEALSTQVWPGDTRAVALMPATAWTNPAAGTITVTIPAADTAALAPGRYQLLTRVTPSGGDPEDAYGCTLDILPAPGSGAAPSAYTTFADLLQYGRSWLRQLQTQDDEAGFAAQQHRAREWVEDLAHAHFRVSSMVTVVGQQAMGPRRSGARSQWLQEQLDNDRLIVTGKVREAAAKKALAYICEGQVGIDKSSTSYARLAGMYHAQADYLGTTLTLEVDTDGDGFSDIQIDCSCTDPMFG